MEIHYNTIQLSVSLLSFPYINPQCPTDVKTNHQSLVIDRLAGGQQVQFQTEAEFFSSLECPNQSCGAPHLMQKGTRELSRHSLPQIASAT